ncbi:MAG TPA: hypothetical protein VGC41_27180 [Kofleriaceae bacterium]
MLHVLLVAAAVHWLNRDNPVELVDIELAPAAPKVEALPEETAKQVESSEEDKTAAAAAAAQEEAAGTKVASGEEGAGLPIDAGVDAPVDAARPTRVAIADAGVDATRVAIADAGADAGADELAGTGSNGVGSGSAGSGEGSDALASGSNGSNGGSNGSNGSNELAANGSNGGSASGSNVGSGTAIASGGNAASGSGASLGTGSAGPGVAGAFETSAGSGTPGVDNQPAVEGAPTSAGTAANLLAYFPPGHTLAVLVRFDRLRGTEWSASAENLFHPMPDYESLFGAKTAGITDKLDMLVISTPRPTDATATTLVMQTHLSRADTRALLANSDAPIAWSATKGGALGKRSGKLFPNDKRVVLSPWKGWYLLAPPEDLAGLTAASSGSIDSIEVKGKPPAWIAGIRSITKESGDDKKGPALVMTVGEPPSTTKPSKTGRYKLPELGLGVRSLPVPQRISLAMELVKQGWLIRGNIVFANEKDATELVTTLEAVKTQITDSHILSGLLRKQHLLNVVTGLTLARSGGRVSYATSISISDARAILDAASQALGGYFKQP